MTDAPKIELEIVKAGDAQPKTSSSGALICPFLNAACLREGCAISRGRGGQQLCALSDIAGWLSKLSEAAK